MLLCLRKRERNGFDGCELCNVDAPKNKKKQNIVKTKAKFPFRTSPTEIEMPFVFISDFIVSSVGAVCL